MSHMIHVCFLVSYSLCKWFAYFRNVLEFIGLKYKIHTYSYNANKIVRMLEKSIKR